MTTMIRKFYEADAPVATGGGMNIAALMATQGVMNNTDNPVAKPIEITEKKEETTPTETAPAATATTDTKVETAISETPSPEVKTEQVVEAQKATPQVQEKSWQEVLKSQQPDSVLKELGFDEDKLKFVKEVKELDPKMVAFLQTWQNGGDVTAYLREMTTDYKSMSAEDVMRHQLRQEYPTASEAQINALFEDEVIEKYKLDTDKYSELETEKGKLLLDAKADRYRAELLKNQEGKLLPKPQEKSLEPDPAIAAREQMIENVTKQFNEDSYTKNVLTTNQVSIGEGEEKFNFPVDSKALIDLAINGDTTGELMFNKVEANGQVNYVPKSDHQILVATVQKYGMSFINELIKHSKSLGGKSAIEPIENAKIISADNSSKAEGAPKTAAEAMAKGGTLNSGGYNR